MAQSAEMLAQIVEKLGMPVITAVSEVERQKLAMGRVQGTPSDESQARLIAELLGKSTELGLMLYRAFDIQEPTESRADAARMGMTALSSTIVASLYGMTGRIPGAPELERLEQVVKSVVAFSENFESGHDSSQALGAADSEKANGLPLLDFVNVHYASALIPVVNAVAAFPFGRQEEQLMREIVERLMGVSQGFCARVYPNLDAEARKAVEVSILKTCANTYAQCHFAEMTQLMSGGDQQKMMAQNISMDGVWGAFDKRLSMLEVVTQSIAGQEGAASAPSSAPPVQPAAATPPPTDITQPAAPAVDITQPPPAAAPVDIAQPAAAPVDITQPPPPSAAPPADITQPAPEVAPQPAAEPPPEDAPAPAGDDSDPMSFFSGPPSSDEGDTGA